MKVTNDGKHVFVKLTPLEARQFATMLEEGSALLWEDGWAWDKRKGARAAAQRVADGCDAVLRAAREA